MGDGERHTILGIDPGTSLMGYAVVSVGGSGKPQPTLMTMGVIRLSGFESHYMRLRRIYERVLALCKQYEPTDLAIEAPFFGKNVQSMLKLGRAQGVAIAAALSHAIPVSEYEPRKIKLSITGNGSASKEQVREILRRTMHIPDTSLESLELDATDALAAAMCHHYTMTSPLAGMESSVTTGKKKRQAGSSEWKDFVAKNPDRVK